MTSFLEYNLNSLPSYNQELVHKIASMQTVSHSYLLDSAESGNAIILIDNLPANDVADPHLEVETIFKSLPDNEPDNFYILAGIEIGYMFDYFVSKCKGNIILFEPWLDSLRVIFELVDFSSSLMKENVFVVTNEKELGAVLSYKGKPESKVHICANKFYQQVYAEELKKVQKYLETGQVDQPQRAIFWLAEPTSSD